MSRVFAFLKDYVGLKAVGLVAKRGAMWVVGGAATAGGVWLDQPTGGRHGALVVPLPAAEGFKDPLMEEYLVESEKLNVLAENESVEWLTESIKPMWKFLDEGLKDFIFKSIEPAIQDAVPYIGSQLKFSKLTIGSQVPELGPVTTHHTDTGVELFVKAHYTGDLAIEFEMGVASVKLGHLTIDGEVLLAFKPIVAGVNPVGGLEICCLDQPDIALNLSAKGLFLDAIPNIYKLVKHAVDGAIASLLVAPNNISVRIPTVTGPETDRATLKYREPLGIMRVNVESAESLSGSIWSMDPYVRLQVGASEWFTDTVNKTLNPVWKGTGMHHVQEFVVYHPKQHLLLEVHDQNTLTSDELVGLCRVPLADIQQGAFTLPLMSAGHRPLPGSVRINTTWLPAVRCDPASLDEYAGAQPSTYGMHPRKDAWRDGRDTPGLGNEIITSLRVDKLSGPALGDGPHRVSLHVCGKEKVSALGRAPDDLIEMKPRPLCRIVHQMCEHGLPNATAAAILGIEEAEFADFAATVKRRSKQVVMSRHLEVEDAEDRKWLDKVHRRLKRHAQYTRPIFEEILHLPSYRAGDFLLRVLGSREGKDGQKEEFVVGEKAFPYSHQGPYHLEGCTVHGTHKVSVLRGVDVRQA